jgi:hypothetical protein
VSGYVKRRIDVTVKLGKGNFGLDGFDTVILKGLRVSAQIQKYGGGSMNTAQIRIYGMDLSLMNRLSTLGKNAGVYDRNNTVAVAAGDDGLPLPTVYQGVIQEGWADFNGAPEVFFAIDSHTGLIDLMKPVPATSYPGPVDVATIMESLANTMSYTFENNGVSVIWPHAYFAGTALAQAKQCAEDADIGFMVDDNKLAIWPKNGFRKAPVPIISAATGMTGYPSYTGNGVRLQTRYNPQIIFGGKIEVDSIITPAKGDWVVNVLSHSLESEAPGGTWFTDMEGWRFGGTPGVGG